MLLNMNNCCYQEGNIHEEMYHRPSMPNIVCLKVISIMNLYARKKGCYK